MKTYIAVTSLLLMMVWSNISFAQVDPNSNDSIVIVIDEPVENEGEDSTEVKVGNIRIIIGDNSKISIGDDDDDDKRSKTEFFAFDLGITNFISSEGLGVDAAGDPRLELQPFRPGAHVALHFLPTRVNVIGRAFSLKTALTVDFNNYYFRNDITLVPRQDQLSILDPDPDGVPFRRNKLATSHFQIPLLLHFDTKPESDDSFKFSVGAYAGVLWGTHTKQRDDNRDLIKVRDDFNLNPWRYGLMARIDISWLRLYAQYNLSEMFRDGEGPSTQTFNIGLNIIDF